MGTHIPFPAPPFAALTSPCVRGQEQWLHLPEMCRQHRATATLQA